MATFAVCEHIFLHIQVKLNIYPFDLKDGLGCMCNRKYRPVSFTWMATKCIFKILDQIYLFPHRSRNNWKLEDFHLNSDQVQIYLFPHRQQKKENWKAFTLMATKCLFKILDKIYLFLDRSQKNWKLEGFHLDCDQVSFQNTQSNLFVSTQVTKEKNIERPSPVWRPSAFSKYSTKFICFHPGHKRKENWKTFTWMATKILYQTYLFPQRSQKTETWKAFTWMTTKFLFKILHQMYLFPHRSQKIWNFEGFHKIYLFLDR